MGIKGHSDLFLAVGVIGILALMIIPLPSMLLDILLALNISAALVLLMVSLYLVNPLELSVFPSMLLILTLFRLSLNIASTRLILGEAFAGDIIRSFGSFVVKGNYIVGFIIFLILVIIQFVVIVKGSGRIAEVAARFTLDAMPGKQMSIDADLNAGLLTEEEARSRRLNISREADFYGAMDGASKFVKGDAIAGLIITSINLVAGLIIGMVQLDMTLAQALQTYSLLTIGDGLVSQIPALLVSTSAGMVVTRAASDENLGTDLGTQLFGNTKALYISSGTLFLFGITPGLPTIPFVLLAAVIGSVGFVLRKEKERDEIAELEIPEDPKLPSASEEIENYLQVDPLELEIGYNLIGLVDKEQGGDLFDRITSMRKQMALELGIIVPPIRVRDNLQLLPDDYVIKIRGNEIAHSEIMMGHFLAMNAGNVDSDIEGQETIEPAFGLPAVWIREDQRHEAEIYGYTVVEPSAVLATHLMEVIRKHADKLLGRQEVQQLLENLKKEYPAIVEELSPDQLSLGGIQKILQNLLREGVPIRDLVTILETVADYTGITKNVEVLTEYARYSLADTIAKLYKDEDGKIRAITLDPQIEQTITSSIQKTKQVGDNLGLSPSIIQSILTNVSKCIEQALSTGYHPVIISSPTVRVYFKKLIENHFPDVAVISFGELPSDIQIESIGKVRLVMKIKKYTGRSFQDAFEQVKKELGENAVILNSRKVKDGGMLDFIGGKEIYEITAAADEGNTIKRPVTAPAPRARQAYNLAGVMEENASAKETAQPETPNISFAPVNNKIEEQTQEIKVLRDEVKDIKKVLNQVSDFLKYSRMPALPDVFKNLLKRLVDNDVHEDLAKAVIQTVYAQTNSTDYKNEAEIVKNLLALLKRMVKTAKPIEKVKRSPYVVALVGPTGVGKTTTVAKLAANLKLYNQSKVALISADTYRIAAIEQLQTFANIATIPMSVVYSPEDMREAIYKFRDFDVILVDTVGRSQKNEQHLRELNQFIEMANPDEVHLVVSLTTALKNTLDIIKRFHIMRPNRILFTKLDEAINTGNILNILYKHQLPVSYMTIGQVVPNDIIQSEAETLANLIFKGVLK